MRIVGLALPVLVFAALATQVMAGQTEEEGPVQKELCRLRAENKVLRATIERLSKEQERLRKELEQVRTLYTELRQTNKRLEVKLSTLKRQHEPSTEKDSITQLPYVGDEVTLPKVYADKDSYFGEQFIMIGALKVKYSNPSDSPGTEYTALWFTNISPSCDYIGHITLVVRKDSGKALASAVAEANSRDKDKVVRVKCFWPKATPSRQTEPGVIFYKNEWEIIGWQFLTDDRLGWTAWHPKKD